MKNFVQFLTVLRLILSPLIFIIAIFLESYFLALILFLVASITDYFDGMLARKYNVESIEGKILDPVADKILIVFSLFTITVLMEDPWIAIMASVILSREFLVSALREFWAINQAETLAVSFLAKLKTTTQFIAISMFLIGLGLNDALTLFIASFVLFLATLITLKTGMDYILSYVNTNKSKQ